MVFSHLTWQSVGRRVENQAQRASAQEVGEKGLSGGMEGLCRAHAAKREFLQGDGHRPSFSRAEWNLRVRDAESPLDPDQGESCRMPGRNSSENSRMSAFQTS